MKLKLLFTGLVFSAFAANAQVATLNENFNNFTAGSTTFPQNNWSAVLPPMTTPPPPMMIVYAEASDATNKYVSSYSGSNKDTPQYLVSPQIVAPTGNKTLSFKARRNVQNAAPVLLQVGLASSPTDMTTFVAVGAPVTLTDNTTYQTITRAIPSSTSNYIVFKTVNAVPGVPHTASDFDDVVYDLTTNLSVSDNFKNNKDIQFAVNLENTALEFVGKTEIKNIDVYSAAGQNVASGKVNNNSFSINTLQTGVYYILIETKDGKAIKSKFIKK
ncbi:T9SS-dependent choice-of-anchor J family protein [Chryseobacterium turcicum]|uniref:T9SS type A sorting domain-containing protein n=1 Tax=Chryseobacterium turcicum TaxID=2898076 RepID=A0A9Q3YY31_9FLAO|nr:choice-of-anchor J domain-containing protein [Chryseobacterium turcicum]MCD1117972.1 T9SS type A sorting domain-containing protein [Chryseobacterium turcicum]